jgi:hypothetical protein
MKAIPRALPRFAPKNAVFFSSLALGIALLFGPRDTARGQGLIGLTFLDGQNTLTVVSIDPTTGTTMPLLATTATGFVGGYVAFDPSSRRLFFEDSSSIYTADLAHGTVSHVPLDLCCLPLEFGTGPVAPVPALDWRGLTVFATALLILGWKLAGLQRE